MNSYAQPRSANSAHLTRGLILGLISLIAAACSSESRDTPPAANAKEPSTIGGVMGTAMVATANPHATNAGEAILRAGGTAVDAAVAIEATLSLVEPQSSGLGGGAFMVYYHEADKTLTVYDGREVAPAGANTDMFLTEGGEPYGYLEAKNSGLSIGVPGVVAMLALAHDERGKLPWAELFSTAESLATDGFDVSPRLRSFFEKYGTRLIPSTEEEGPLDAYRYFFDEEDQLRTRLVNLPYAETLRAIAADPAAMYRGDIASAIVSAAAHTPRAGTLSLEDLAAYDARRLDALCFEYRSLDICGPPPPSSWVAVAMTLGLLEGVSFPSGDRLSDWKTFTEAQRLAYADRDYFVADDSVVPVPIPGMMNREYLASRSGLIDSDAAIESVSPGNPWDYQQVKAAMLPGQDTTIDYAGTSHFVVVDQWGNVVSMTASVESIFGSARMAGGMFLNNQLTDFAKQPRDAEGKLAANHPAPGKRPRSSMSPTIVLDKQGDFRLATGSPGGNSIIAYTAKSLVGMLDWGLSPQEAISLPNVVARGDTVRIETERASPEMIEAMRAHGFNVKESAGENSGLSVILRHEDGRLEGGVDPRREGTIATIAP